jgi:uncharacterized membrane protein
MEQQTTEQTGWVGWVEFAGIMMIILGALNAVYGLVAILNDDWVVFANRGQVYLDLTAWGWVHLIAGILIVLSGIGVLSGMVIARVIAVIVVGLSLIANFLAIPVYPLWSLVLVTIEVVVIWALIAHGGELKT